MIGTSDKTVIPGLTLTKSSMPMPKKSKQSTAQSIEENMNALTDEQLEKIFNEK